MPRFRKTSSKHRSVLVESLSRLIQDLNLSDVNQLIVVEGNKDREALLKLGVKTRIMTLRGFMRLASTDWLEKGEFSEVVVLTDFDRRGRSHSVKIRKICSGRVKVNTDYKVRLRQALGSCVKEVEGIPRFIRSESGYEEV